MVYGVSRIVLPSLNWDDSLRADGPADFVAGPENRLVVPALERLLHGDDVSLAAQLFNPLVLLGTSGTGKSQLARGVVRRWSSLLGESSVEYFTAIDFARQLRAAREENLLDEFRQRLAELQLLVVEDLQRLPTNLFVQRELRDLLDTLIDAQAVVLVTVQQPPAAMASLESGLRDRLSAGLTVLLQTPGMEARLELLKQSAEDRQLALGEDQLRQLAQKANGPVPQLSRLLAEFELSAGGQPQLNGSRAPLRIKQIIAVVARYFSLTQAALCSPTRRKSLVYARNITVYLARSLTDLSYAQIGQALGRRDHTTIMHARSTIEKRLACDAATQKDVEELKRILTAD